LTTAVLLIKLTSASVAHAHTSWCKPCGRNGMVISRPTEDGNRVQRYSQAV